MAEFASVLDACFERRSLELIRGASYLLQRYSKIRKKASFRKKHGAARPPPAASSALRPPAGRNPPPPIASEGPFRRRHRENRISSDCTPGRDSARELRQNPSTPHVTANPLPRKNPIQPPRAAACGGTHFPRQTSNPDPPYRTDAPPPLLRSGPFGPGTRRIRSRVRRTTPAIRISTRFSREGPIFLPYISARFPNSGNGPCNP